MSDRNHRQSDRRRDSRSRSPRTDDFDTRRTRSPHSHHKRRKRSPKPEMAKELPYGSRYLTKRDYTVFRPMFALYLDIQKQKVLDDLDEVEAKGRWKSFIGKWNRGELSEGWYDPATLQKALASATEPPRDLDGRKEESSGGREKSQFVDKRPKRGRDPSSDSEDSVGPSLPGKEGRGRVSRLGPSIPNLDDLELKREMDLEATHASHASLQHERKTERSTQKALLDELVPRSAAGTHERRLEKKADLNAKLRSFRDKSPGGEVPEAELMGGGEDGVADFKRQKQEVERKKNERELRREEVLRARAAEREERMREYRGREEKTMEMLKGLAKQNFG